MRTEQQITDIMRKVKSRNTAPELALRKALWARGLRYRLHARDLPGKPDIVFRKSRLAVFVDGDFWHGNQWRSRGHESLEAQFVGSPKADYWIPKIDRNMRRDRINTAKLLSEGWKVLRFWESSLKSDIENCTDITLQAIERMDHKPAARMPQRTAVVVGDAETADISAGLESAGWQIVSPDDAAGKAPTISLLVVSAERVEPISTVYRLSGQEDEALPPMLLFRYPCSLIEGQPCLAVELLEKLSRTGYAVDLFLIQHVGLFVFGLLPHETTIAAIISLARPRSVIDLITRNPGLNWHCPPLPSPPSFVEADNTRREVVRWISDVYLNPVITSAIHSAPLVL